MTKVGAGMTKMRAGMTKVSGGGVDAIAAASMPTAAADPLACRSSLISAAAFPK
jgi:hypothetical protein